MAGLQDSRSGLVEPEILSGGSLDLGEFGLPGPVAAGWTIVQVVTSVKDPADAHGGRKVRFGHVGTHADHELSFQNAERFGVDRGKLPMTSIMPPQQWHR